MVPGRQTPDGVTKLTGSEMLHNMAGSQANAHLFARSSPGTSLTASRKAATVSSSLRTVSVTEVVDIFCVTGLTFYSRRPSGKMSGFL